MSTLAADGATSGKIINLVSSDAQKVYELLPIVQMLWAAPVIIIGGTALMINLIGKAAIVGVGFLCLMVPINAFFAKWIAGNC